ncbi:MAG: transposase, partial [Sulfurimicrobium sp.]|nr:transposase [Sulfurimicrobium sp.]
LQNPAPTMPYTHLRKGRFSQTGMVYHITTATLHRTPHFSDLAKGRKVVQELKTLQEQGKAETLCYVLMPDHLHWLMALQDGELSGIMHLLKGRSARAIGYSLWQANYYDHAVRQEEDLRKMARYMVANPLRANLVNSIGDYPLWDAVWLDDTLSG